MSLCHTGGLEQKVEALAAAARMQAGAAGGAQMADSYMRLDESSLEKAQDPFHIHHEVLQTWMRAALRRHKTPFIYTMRFYRLIMKMLLMCSSQSVLSVMKMLR